MVISRMDYWAHAITPGKPWHRRASRLLLTARLRHELLGVDVDQREEATQLLRAGDLGGQYALIPQPVLDTGLVDHLVDDPSALRGTPGSLDRHLPTLRQHRRRRPDRFNNID